MADINVLADSTTNLTLNDGDDLFVAPGVSLVAISPAVRASGENNLAILGTVYTHSGIGISAQAATEFALDIGSTGFVGANGSAVRADISDRADIINNGEIVAGAFGLSIQDNGADAEINIANFGSIQSDGYAINIANTGSGLNLITNTGTMFARNIGVLVSSETMFDNFGLLSVPEGNAYSGADVTDTIRNYGTITEIIRTHDGDDSLTNSGLVARVELGEGNDTYEGRGGSSTGEIRGEGGNDTLKGGNEADLLFGGTEDDVLRGRKGDDEISGGNGNDEIHGNRGDDTLSGGDNGDTFVFNANGGFDTITDYGGNDEIDLTALGLRRFSKDIEDNIQDVKEGSVIDLDKDYDLVIFLQGVDADDLDSSDFIL